VTAATELINAGHYAEAAQMYEQLLARNPQDAALRHFLGGSPGDGLFERLLVRVRHTIGSTFK
jgi:hypothetical protein